MNTAETTGEIPKYDPTLPQEVVDKLIPPPKNDGEIMLAEEINVRITSIEEAVVAKREPHKEFNIESLETGDGPLMRIVSKDGETLSPLFFSKNCLDHYVTRLPLLSHSEWDTHPLKGISPMEANEAN